VVVADVLQRGCDTFNEIVVANGRHGLAQWAWLDA